LADWEWGSRKWLQIIQATLRGQRDALVAAGGDKFDAIAGGSDGELL
jgi:hypothetical protein